MQLNTDLIHNSDLQVTKLISQSIAVSSLKEQKGQLPNFTEKTKTRGRKSSFSDCGWPSICSGLFPHSPVTCSPSISLSPRLNQPQPCQTLWASAWASQSVPVNLGRNLTPTAGYHPHMEAVEWHHSMLISLGMTNNRIHTTSTRHREPSAVLRDTAAWEHSLKFHAANQSCHSKT